MLSRRGTRFFYVGAFVPQTVGGRRAHPPKAEKEWDKKINIKERRKAIRSALAATMIPNLVMQRGHKLPKGFPFVRDESFESLNKTKDIMIALQTLGFQEEIDRAAKTTTRAGIGKRRGRKTITKKSFLFVVGKDCPLLKAATNIAGADVVPVQSLNTELLAPGTHEGRLTLFTEGALDAISQRQLFTDIKQVGGLQ